MELKIKDSVAIGVLAAAAGIAICNNGEKTPAPVEEETTMTTERVRNTFGGSSQEMDPHRDPTLEEDLPEDCTRPDGQPYLEQNDDRYLSQWNDPRNFAVDTWAGINCTAAEIANREKDVTIDWIYATLVAAGLDVTMTENLEGIVFNDGKNRVFINPEEPDCDPQGGCSYAIETKTFSVEAIDTSLETAANCIAKPERCTATREDVYIEGEAAAFTADSPEELAEQVSTTLKALKANSEDTAQ